MVTAEVDMGQGLQNGDSFENICIFRDWLPFRSHIEKVHKKVVC